MDRKTNVILVIVAMVVVTAAVWFVYFRTKGNVNNGGNQNNQGQKNQNFKAVNNFDECTWAGYTVFESYPRKCVSPDRKTYTEDIGNELEKTDLIRISSPRPNNKVESPLKITGEARGLWFFEAVFPIKILDASGKELGTAIAQAKSDWMTDDFVPFEATLNFQPSGDKGTLVLERDNPSGLKENEDSLRIPVNFNKGNKTQIISIFLYNENNDKDTKGNVICSAQGLAPVKRTVDKSDKTLENTLGMLLAGRISQDEKNRGLTTNFPLEGVELKNLNLDNGVLSLTFNDPKNKTSGGSCRVNIMRTQIEMTAKQFPEVKSVKFLPEETFQP